MSTWVIRLFLFASLTFSLLACGDRPSVSLQGNTILPSPIGNSSANVPTAVTFQHPIPGFDVSDYGLGFGSENHWFCMKRSTDGQCIAYGGHLGRDTVVGHTPEGTEVFAPADGIVRVTTDLTFGGYGSDSSANASYNGCVIVLEHRLGNGQAVTTLLGHIRCDGTSYDAERRRGNPPVGTLVRRGQYLARVGHYWHGSGRSTDWHHLHWSMRKGSFTATRYTKADVLPWVQGYAPRSEFKTDSGNGALTHPTWLDPFAVIEGNGDPAQQAVANIRHHPSGSLLRDPNGDHWFVKTDEEIALIPAAVISSDRYDDAGAVPVSYEEVDCYRHAEPVSSVGRTTLYVRPGSSAVVVAYPTSRERYDFIRWEALLSWGFVQEDIQKPSSVATYEAYAPRGFRLLRPGTLVKADEESEVAIITADQKRLPIVSGDVFEQAGFKWERIVSLPKSVLDQVAGPRDNVRMLTRDEIIRCAVPPGCPGGDATCGGGAPPGCVPGETVGCPCFDGLEGMRVCSDDGQSFSTCDCPSQPDDNIHEGGTSGRGSVQGGTGGVGGDPSSSAGTASSVGGIGGMPGTPETGGSSSGGMIVGGGAGASSVGGAGSSPVSSAGMSGGPPIVIPPIPSGPLHLVYRSPVAGSLTIQGWWTRPDRTNRGWAVIDCPDVNPADDLLECDLPVESGSPLFEFQMYLPDGRYWGDQACDSGGCGVPLGTLTLMKGEMNVPVTFVPNPYGAPYYNGQLKPVP